MKHSLAVGGAVAVTALWVGAPAQAATHHQDTHRHACSIQVDKLSGYQGASVTNTAVVKGCRDPQPITTSVQIYPVEAYSKGICKATGKCHHVATYAHVLPIGTSTFTDPLPTDCGLFLQVDHKDSKGRLIRAEHLTTKKCATTPPTPTPKPPITKPHTPAVDKPHARVRLTSSTPAAELPRTGGLYTAGLGGAAVAILAGIGLLTKVPRAQRKAWTR